MVELLLFIVGVTWLIIAGGLFKLTLEVADSTGFFVILFGLLSSLGAAALAIACFLAIFK